MCISITVCMPIGVSLSMSTSVFVSMSVVCQFQCLLHCQCQCQDQCLSVSGRCSCPENVLWIKQIKQISDLNMNIKMKINLNTDMDTGTKNRHRYGDRQGHIHVHVRCPCPYLFQGTCSLHVCKQVVCHMCSHGIEYLQNEFLVLHHTGCSILVFVGFYFSVMCSCGYLILWACWVCRMVHWQFSVGMR